MAVGCSLRADGEVHDVALHHRAQPRLQRDAPPQGSSHHEPRRRRDGEGGRTVGEAFGHLEDPCAPAPDATLLEGELQAAITEAIGSLPETQRMALVLRRYEDLSYEEIAETLGQTVPAVKSLLFRARTLLREKLGRYLDA